MADTLPLTPHTRHTFGIDQFRLMKPSAYFFNVGRGGTVNQDDLIAALESGEIAGAGLDVTGAGAAAGGVGRSGTCPT